MVSKSKGGCSRFVSNSYSNRIHHQSVDSHAYNIKYVLIGVLIVEPRTINMFWARDLIYGKHTSLFGASS